MSFSALLRLVSAIVVFGSVGCFNKSAERAPSPSPSSVLEQPTPQKNVATPEKPSAPQSSQGSPNIVTVVAKARPAVVQITNEQILIDRFNQTLTVPAGVGSGIVYDARGLILTNNHVVRGAESLLVTLPDERTFPARLVGTDAHTDIAVIQISGPNLPFAVLGDSSKLAVGEWVVAIGNALGLPGGPTVSVGVVSAKGRTIQAPGDSFRPGPYLFDLIQTSAPVNPGNSGGALINLAGEVVGINTLIAAESDLGTQPQGIGFAISINSARTIANQLVTTGHAVHSYLGATYTTLTPSIAYQLRSNVKRGVVVIDAAPGSPAALAGLQRADIITRADRESLASDSDLARIVDSHKPGEKLTLTIVKAAVSTDVVVTLTELPP